MPDKILLIGPVNGRLSELVAKVSAIEAKHGSFAALFILGDLFHPAPTDSLLSQQTDLLQGKLSLSVPTYFYQGTSPLSTALEGIIAKASESADSDVPKGLVKVATNLYYAQGKSGVYVLPSGFRVAFAGGRWDPKAFAEANEGLEPFDPESWHETPLQRTQDEALPYITPATINRLLAHPSFQLPSSPSAAPSGSKNGTKPGTLAAARAAAEKESLAANAQSSALNLLTSRPPIDLLLTNTWPTGVTLFSTPPNSSDPLGGLPDGTARMWGSPLITRLVSCACPRYHFSLAPSESSADLPVGISPETVEMGAFWERAPYVTDLSAYLPQPLPDTPQGRREREKLKSVTRFVSLAKFANEKKRRWFLALNLTPAEKQGEVVKVPGNATQTPYFLPSPQQQQRSDTAGKRGAGEGMEEGANYRFAESARRKRQRGEDVPPPGYVCRICGVEGHYIRLCPSKGAKQSAAPSGPNNVAVEGSGTQDETPKRTWTKSTMPLPAGLPSKPTFATPSHPAKRQLIPVGPSNCWFCLSNPSVAKSLIITIGSDTYLAFPKGPFLHPTINSIPHSGAHLLIVPLTHTSHLLPASHPVVAKSEDEEEEREKERVKAEVEETKQNVRELWGREGHVMLEWTLVRVRTSSRMTHMQTQLLALKSDVVEEKNVAQHLDDALESLDSLTILRDPNDIAGYFTQSTPQREGADEDGYFSLTLHLPTGRKAWLVPLKTTSRFPVQFVRTTLAGLFELPHLADWKTCLPSPEDDSEDAQRQNSAAFRGLLLKSSS